MRLHWLSRSCVKLFSNFIECLIELPQHLFGPTDLSHTIFQRTVMFFKALQEQLPKRFHWRSFWKFAIGISDFKSFLFFHRPITHFFCLPITSPNSLHWFSGSLQVQIAIQKDLLSFVKKPNDVICELGVVMIEFVDLKSRAFC